MKTMEFNQGDVIFRQGDPGESLYDVRSGRVGIYVNCGKENEEKLTELTAGAFFGEMALIDKAPRSATAVALEDGTALCALGEADLTALFASEPEKVLRIMRNLSGRLRDLTGDYLRACATVAALSEAEEKRKEPSEALRGQAAYYGEFGRRDEDHV